MKQTVVQAFFLHYFLLRIYIGRTNKKINFFSIASLNKMNEESISDVRGRSFTGENIVHTLFSSSKTGIHVIYNLYPLLEKFPVSILAENIIDKSEY